MSDASNLAQEKRELAAQLEKQGETVRRLTEITYKQQQQLHSTEIRGSAFESQLQTQTKVNKELEERLGREVEALMKARTEIKELERVDAIVKLSYESEKVQAEVIKKENDRLVLIAHKI